MIISWLQSPSAVILELRKIKSDTVSTVSPSISHPSAGDLRELPRVPLRGEGSCGGGGAPRDSAGPRSQASLQKAQGPGVCKLPKPPASRASLALWLINLTVPHKQDCRRTRVYL